MAQVEALGSVLTLEQIADYFGVNVETFRLWRRKNPEIERRWKKGKTKAIRDVGMTVLSKALAGSERMAIFYQKTQAGWHDPNLPHRLELSGRDGKPIQMNSEQTRLIEVLHHLDDDSLELLMEALSPLLMDAAQTPPQIH